MTTSEQFAVTSADHARGTAATGHLPTGLTQLRAADAVSVSEGSAKVLMSLLMVVTVPVLGACASAAAPSPEGAGGAVQPLFGSYTRAEAITKEQNTAFIDKLEQQMPGFKVESVTAVATSDAKVSYTLLTLRSTTNPKAPLKYMVNIDVPTGSQGQATRFTGPVDQIRAPGADGMVKWQVFLAPIDGSQAVAPVWNAKTADKGDFQILEMDFQANQTGALALQPGETAEQWSSRITREMVNGNMDVIRALAENTQDPSRLKRLAIGNPLLNDTKQTWEATQANRTLLDALLAPNGVAYAAAADATATPDAAQPTDVPATDVPATPTDAPATAEASPTPEVKNQFTAGELPTSASRMIDLAGLDQEARANRVFQLTWDYVDYTKQTATVSVQILLSKSYYDKLISSGQAVNPQTIAGFVSQSAIDDFKVTVEGQWNPKGGKDKNGGWKNSEPIIVLTGENSGWIFGSLFKNGPNMDQSARVIGGNKLINPYKEAAGADGDSTIPMWSDSAKQLYGNGLVMADGSTITAVKSGDKYKALPYPLTLTAGLRTDQIKVMTEWNNLSVADREAILSRWFSLTVNKESFDKADRSAVYEQLREQFLRTAQLTQPLELPINYPGSSVEVKYYTFGGSILDNAVKPDMPIALLYGIKRVTCVPGLSGVDPITGASSEVYSTMSAGEMKLNPDLAFWGGSNKAINWAMAIYWEALNGRNFGIGPSQARVHLGGARNLEGHFLDRQNGLMILSMIDNMVASGAATKGEFSASQFLSYLNEARAVQAKVFK